MLYPLRNTPLDMELLDYRNRMSLFHDLAEGVVLEVHGCISRAYAVNPDHSMLASCMEAAQICLRLTATGDTRRILKLSAILTLKQAVAPCAKDPGVRSDELLRALKLLEELLGLVAG